MFGVNDLEGLFQSKQFHVSVVLTRMTNGRRPPTEQSGSTGLLYLHHREMKAVIKHTTLTNQSLQFIAIDIQVLKRKTER